MMRFIHEAMNVTLLALLTISQPILLIGAEKFTAPLHTETCSLIQTNKIAIIGSVSREKHSNGESDGDLCSRNTSHFTPVRLETSCPEGCPFSQRLPDDHCRKVCVKSEGCRAFHPLRSFADPKSKECVATCGKKTRDHVGACAVCAGVGQCKTCHSGFYLDKNGHCAGHLSTFWKVVYCVLATLAILMATYLFNLRRRPTINHDVLNHALNHRDESKVWVRREKDNEWHRHKILETAVHSHDISGQGVLLYFSFLNFAMLMASILLIGVFITYHLSVHREDMEEDCHSVKISLGSESIEHKGAHESHHQRMFLGLLTIYTIVLVCSLVHVWHQTNTSYRWDETHATHEDYALRVVGLPRDACDPTELKDFFTSALETVLRLQESTSSLTRSQSKSNTPHIIGVSIAYDYKEHENFIEECLDDWVTDLEVEAGRRDFKHRPSTLQLDSSRLDDQSADDVESTQRRSAFKILELRFLDYFFWGSCDDDEDVKEIDAARCRDVLLSLKCSGSAYVIGSTPEVVELLYPFFKDSNYAPLFRGKHKIMLNEVFSEPMSLTWANFTEVNFWPRIFLGVFLLLMTIVLWLCLYLPYALSVTHTMRVPGAQPGFLEGNMLGLLIAVGNAIVAKVVDIVTSWAGFKQKDRHDIAVMSLALLATLLNTGFDVWMVLKIAQRAELSNLFEDTDDRIVARELMSIIVPGYLIVPYIATPMFEHVLPYHLGTWFVRSKRASIRQAEKFLECPEFDICWRYSDILNNFTICLLMLMFISPKSHEVMCWLLVFLFLLYGIDKYKLLRETSQTFYTTSRLEDAAQFWWALPSGLLAGITVGRACNVHANILPPERANLLSVLGFLAHVVLYTLLCKLVRSCVKPPDTEATTYHEMCEQLRSEGKVWSYFNTNPIFCLRSKYLDMVEPGVDVYPCIPFVPGKQFLQPGVPKSFKQSGRRKGLLKKAEKFVTAFAPVTPHAKKGKVHFPG